MASYVFITDWRLQAPLEHVFAAIRDSLDWPQWWPGVEAVVETAPGDAAGIGAIRHYCWKSRLPYRIRFDARVLRQEPNRMLQGEARGEVDGIGTWTFSEHDGVTSVHYEWRVTTTKPWMNWLAPLLRRAFRWNHDWLMEQGGHALARRLGARLLDIRHG